MGGNISTMGRGAANFRAMEGHRAPRGQSLVLTALLMLFLTVAMMLTFAIGHRTREKIKLQATADTAAFSLAVAQARAFNFYAYSNRAIVSHLVGVLSAMAHQSHNNWNSDALRETPDLFRQLSATYQGLASTGCGACSPQAMASAATYTKQIADIYDWMTPTIDGRFVNYEADLHNFPDGHVYIEQGGRPVKAPLSMKYHNPGGSKSALYAPCVGSAAERGQSPCQFPQMKGPRGAKFLFMQVQSKADAEPCNQHGQAYTDHWEKVQLLRGHQHNVESQLLSMLGGVDERSGRRVRVAQIEAQLNQSNRTVELVDDWDGDARTCMDGTSSAHCDFGTARRPLAQTLASRVDPKIRSLPGAGALNVAYYDRAVANVPLHSLKEHEDYDEILAATRYPRWLTDRQGGYYQDENWKGLERLANTVSPTASTSVRIYNRGNAKALSINATGTDTELDDDAANQFNRILTASDPGKMLARAVYSSDPNRGGFGNSSALGTVDYGFVAATFTPGCGCARSRSVQIRSGRNGTWNDGANGAYFGLEHTHGHFAGSLWGWVGSGNPEEVDGDYYLGHMRYRLGDTDALWNMPRTVVMLEKPTSAAERQVWDFDFRVHLPLPASFRTVDTEGDRAAGLTMAAVAAGLVYFHKPEGSGDAYKEPPNLWNPYWRAKLHPVRAEDAAAAGHGATLQLLGQPGGSRWINY